MRGRRRRYYRRRRRPYRRFRRTFRRRFAAVKRGASNLTLWRGSASLRSLLNSYVTEQTGPQFIETIKITLANVIGYNEILSFFLRWKPLIIEHSYTLNHYGGTGASVDSASVLTSPSPAFYMGVFISTPEQTAPSSWTEIRQRSYKWWPMLPGKKYTVRCKSLKVLTEVYETGVSSAEIARSTRFLPTAEYNLPVYSTKTVFIWGRSTVDYNNVASISRWVRTKMVCKYPR